MPVVEVLDFKANPQKVQGKSLEALGEVRKILTPSFKDNEGLWFHKSIQ